MNLERLLNGACIAFAALASADMLWSEFEPGHKPNYAVDISVVVLALGVAATASLIKHRAFKKPTCDRCHGEVTGHASGRGWFCRDHEGTAN